MTISVTAIASRDAAAIGRAAMHLKAASEPHRLGVLLALAGGERNVGELCEDLDGLRQSHLSPHLATLRHSGLVESGRRGQRVYYNLAPRGLALLGVVEVLMERSGS